MCCVALAALVAACLTIVSSNRQLDGVQAEKSSGELAYELVSHGKLPREQLPRVWNQSSLYELHNNTLKEAAQKVLAGYEQKMCVLANAGYIDLFGNVWACTVMGDGWVDVLVLRDQGSGLCVVETLRMNANDWGVVQGGKGGGL